MRIKFKPYPKNYSLRIRSGFLWFPKMLDDEWRWLEHATWVELYTSIFEKWIDLHWVDEDDDG